MKLWEPKSCCFCFDAKNGSLVIASIRLITALFQLVLCASGFFSDLIRVTGQERLPLCVRNPDGYMCQQQLSKTVILLHIAIVSLYSVQALVSIMLIHGIRKKKHLLMLPFMSFFSAGLCFYILTSIATAIYFAPYVSSTFWSNLGVVVFVVMVEILFLIVVRSHYMEVKRETTNSYTKLKEHEITA